MVLNIHPIRAGYIIVFSLTAIACFGAIARARSRLEDKDTRWGLVSLLATSGLWAGFHVGRIVAPLPALKITFYLLGLVVGMASVGAWLYFCSAYVGETYHHHRGFRWAAVGIFCVIVSVKLTSPLHDLYFTTTSATTPYPHLVIELHLIHWVVTGLAYALSAIGFYMLFDLFQDSNYATTRLGVLVGLAGLPVLFDIIGYSHPGAVITMNYEPIGVGLFALGVLYVADGSFVAVRQFGREQLLDEIEEGVVVLDDNGVIQDVNTAAREMFPSLSGALGESITAAAPDIASHLPVEQSEVIEFETSRSQRYYLLSGPELRVGQATIGRALVFTDITDVERQRRELERHRDQLDDFGEAITHELRNTVNIVQNHLQLIGARLDPETEIVVQESIATVEGAVDRMTDIVSDLATLSRFGGTAEQTTTVDIVAVARQVFESVSGTEHSLTITNADTIEADGARLECLFEKLFTFAIKNGATQLSLTQRDGEFTIADNGEPIAEADIERAFAYGQAVPDAESGMLLPIAKTFAEAHGWTITIDSGYSDGVRIVVSQ